MAASMRSGAVWKAKVEEGMAAERKGAGEDTGLGLKAALRAMEGPLRHSKPMHKFLQTGATRMLVAIPYQQKAAAVRKREFRRTAVV